MKRRLSWWRRCSGSPWWRRCSGSPSWVAAAFVSLAVLAVPNGAASLDAAGDWAGDWAGVPGPTATPSQAIGGYSLGCLEGAAALGLDGPGYHVMRPSRARYFGHPNLIRFVRWLGNEAVAQGNSGILVGDLAQARGGPMSSGHASHQSGLDVDIWFLPAPDQPPTLDDREILSAISMVTEDGLKVGENWTIGQVTLLRVAAGYPDVDRIFVNAAIKQELCETAGSDRAWLAKIRPWWGHDHHFHVRLACPGGDVTCIDQFPPPPGDGCGMELAWWFSSEARQALADQQKAPRRRIAMADLPAECEAVYHWSSTTSAGTAATTATEPSEAAR
jgi:penicillin-insensitive murein DD-endopeptidase